MFATEQTGHARWIAGFILAHGAGRIAARDIMRFYRALRAPESRLEILETMANLEAMGWIRAELAKERSRERAERQAASARVRETLAKYFKRGGR